MERILKKVRFSLTKKFHYQQNIALKTKRIRLSEKTNVDIFINYFVNITKSSNFSEWKPEKTKKNPVLEKIMEVCESHLSHILKRLHTEAATEGVL